MSRSSSRNAAGESTADESAADESPAYAASYADVDAQQLVRVGFVYRPHGVHGEIKVDPEDTGDPTRYEHWDRVFVGREPQAVTRHAITGVRYQETKRGTTVILTLDGIDDRDDAEAIMKATVFVAEDDLELDEDEVFIHELIGLDVETEDGTPVGTVVNLLEHPAHDVLVVQQAEGGEALVPAVDDFIREFNLDARRVVIRPIDGLLD
jgi:16S rRNA processing protein RimM